VDIKFLGLTSVLIKTKKATLVIDPLNKDTGAKGVPTKADIVCITRPKSAYFKKDRIKETYLIDKPGEYEVQGIMVFGMPVLTDGKLGIAYYIHAEEVGILHLGGLAKKPKNGLLEDLSRVDVFLAPVGGMFSLDAKSSREIAKSIEPSYVVPINYSVKGMPAELSAGLAKVDEFLKEMQVKGSAEEPKLKIKKTQIRDEGDVKTEVVVLTPQCFK
jgi:L-ascorbate metabolism protein UlaG (beta-lactamase superfamily)